MLVDWVVTPEMLDLLVNSVEAGESCTILRRRRSGKSTLVAYLSMELRERGIDHRVVTLSRLQAAKHRERGCDDLDVCVQGERPEGVRVLILDEPWFMSHEYVEYIRTAAPVLIEVGTPSGRLGVPINDLLV